MLKNISNLGTTLKTSEQKLISGGLEKRPPLCQNQNCPPGYCCGSDPYFCVLALPGGRNCR